MKEKVTFIDFETTGFSQNRALALAIIHYEKNVRDFEKYYLINPHAPIEAGAFKVHGITYNEVRDKPGFDEIWGEIKPYIENNLVVAHNARFDIRVLLGELERYNLECGRFSYFCTCANARVLNLPVDNYKLDTLSRYFHISLLNHHNALEDTIACENIYFHLQKIGGNFKTYSAKGRQILEYNA